MTPDDLSLSISLCITYQSTTCIPKIETLLYVLYM